MKKILAFALALAASPVAAAPVQWSVDDGGNGHWYDIVGDGFISWTRANKKAAASSHQGQFGYLATITSIQEQLFLNAINADFAKSKHKNYVAAWLGGTDAHKERDWKWVTGEAGTYENWAHRQPDNFFNEDYLVGWAYGDQWNDCSNNCFVKNYVVEYNDAPSAVPLPASLPLIAAALGGLGWVSRRRKTA